MTSQYVDPAVSEAKFDREVNEYRALEAGYRMRGWFLVDATFPVIRVLLCATRLRPPAVITGVELDYTNYDEEPPSVHLIDPFSGEPYQFGQLPTTLKRRTLGPAIDIPGMPKGPDGNAPRMLTEQPLMQASTAEEIPFLCIAGVREYHAHPAHSGDSWDLHRPGGAGRLVRLLEVIDTYGVRPISNYNIALVQQVTGFVQDDMPE